MMDSQYKLKIKVGFYLAIGILCILVSIFFLGADKALFTHHVNLHAHFDQVQGLAVGSLVSISGVTAGNVKAVNFIENENKLDVIMRVDEKYIKRIHKDSEVEIRTQGALGDKYIFIFPGDSRQPEISEDDILPVSTSSDIMGVISERGSEASRIFDIIDDLQKISKSLTAEDRLGKIMKNLDSTSASLSHASKDAENLMNSLSVSKNAPTTETRLSRTLERLDSILTKIDNADGTLGLLINDPTVHNQMKTYLGGSERKNHLKTLLRTSIEKEDK